MTLTIKASWIKETREGRNDNWNYDYKELLLNENPAHISCLRIPVNALGIKAIEYNADHGITNEYTQVYIDNDDSGAGYLHHRTTTLFDIRYTSADHADHLAEQVSGLTALHKDAMDEVKRLEKMYDPYCIENRNLKATTNAQSQEIILLKAKLYDLITAGA
ncbi:MAG: hypothetical protein FWB91_00355 [Defluviitaleaceae bacterium]|nr:hypothetical protein [Defluviitaleaceae bacterium]